MSHNDPSWRCPGCGHDDRHDSDCPWHKAMLDASPATRIALLREDNRKLRERVAALEAALEFYADESNYTEETDDHLYSCPIGADDGSRARAVLAPGVKR